MRQLGERFLAHAHLASLRFGPFRLLLPDLLFCALSRRLLLLTTSCLFGLFFEPLLCLLGIFSTALFARGGVALLFQFGTFAGGFGRDLRRRQLFGDVFFKRALRAAVWNRLLHAEFRARRPRLAAPRRARPSRAGWYVRA